MVSFQEHVWLDTPYIFRTFPTFKAAISAIGTPETTCRHQTSNKAVIWLDNIWQYITCEMEHNHLPIQTTVCLYCVKSKQVVGMKLGTRKVSLDARMINKMLVESPLTMPKVASTTLQPQAGIRNLINN